jgi:hypothetical protein
VDGCALSILALPLLNTGRMRESIFCRPMQGNPTPTPQGIGAQPANGLLSALGLLTDNGILEKIGAGTASVTLVGSTGRDVLAASDPATARGAMGLGTAATANTGTTTGTIPLLKTGNALTVSGDWISTPLTLEAGWNLFSGWGTSLRVNPLLRLLLLRFALVSATFPSDASGILSWSADYTPIGELAGVPCLSALNPVVGAYTDGPSLRFIRLGNTTATSISYLIGQAVMYY